ncbi:unnamed protein product [Symbiodinium natans]|uniref:Uncharacterized protein n=1 Tax=Symbiodinium natans TaxID=878477 RepID=A0A812PST4_9DINO|nr:unnamed protein product [Symbiodinium natans]
MESAEDAPRQLYSVIDGPEETVRSVGHPHKCKLQALPCADYSFSHWGCRVGRDCDSCLKASNRASLQKSFGEAGARASAGWCRHKSVTWSSRRAPLPVPSATD